ncbi:MAG: diaminopimelate decarboxylase [Candidatus Aminicenantes bacterium]|jgi:diaminopimelate decarboxylase
MNWWENSFLKVKGGKLLIGGREAAVFADQFGTPLFIYSRRQIQSNLEKLRGLFQAVLSPDVRICYALKANANLEILEFLKDREVWVDAVSPGEVDIAVQAGFDPERIIFTGTSVSPEDIENVFSQTGVIVNIDAVEQLEFMKDVKERLFPNKRIKVSVRWNPGIGKGFSPKTVTAGQFSLDGTPVKFGVEEKRVLSTFQKASRYGFQPVALHQHLGSGWTEKDLKDVLRAVEKMLHKALELEKEGFQLEFLDFGGGFGPQYAEEQRVFPLKTYAEFIGENQKKIGLKVKTIALEPGKYLVGDAGILLMKVEYLKESYGNLFACVNAGTFNTVPRPAIYTQAHHHIINCDRISADKTVEITVAGNLCETGDVFGKKIQMPQPKRGDILALLNAGAYCRSMASNFNMRAIPDEIVLDDIP